MKKAALALLFACAGCLSAPRSDTSVDEESIDEAAQAVGAVSGALSPPTGATLTSLDDLPHWHIFLRGEDAPTVDNPGLRDTLGQVVAVRRGDEADPGKWVTLRLGHHWMLGDRYIDELRASGVVSATDLLMIASELLAHGNDLRRLPAQAGKLGTFDCYECGRGSPYNPFPGIFGDDHMGSPLGERTGKPSHPHPSGRPPGVKPPVPTVGHPRPRPPPPTPEKLAAMRAYLNGVREGDPAPLPFPTGAEYHPSRYEPIETFKCEGRAYHGYKHACIDFQPQSVGVKWAKKLSAWAGRYFDPNNIAMSHEDWTTLCKLAATVATFSGCLAVIASCGTAETMTFGTVTIPCFWLTGVICGGHAGVTQGILFDRCGILMGAR